MSPHGEDEQATKQALASNCQLIQPAESSQIATAAAFLPEHAITTASVYYWTGGGMTGLTAGKLKIFLACVWCGWEGSSEEACGSSSLGQLVALKVMQNVTLVL